jgi:hypothetical protein
MADYVNYILSPNAILARWTSVTSDYIDLPNRKLTHSGGLESAVNWGGGGGYLAIQDAYNTKTLDWKDCKTYDKNNPSIESLNWHNRTATNSSGNEVINWSGSATAIKKTLISGYSSYLGDYIYQLGTGELYIYNEDEVSYGYYDMYADTGGDMWFKCYSASECQVEIAAKSDSSFGNATLTLYTDATESYVKISNSAAEDGIKINYTDGEIIAEGSSLFLYADVIGGRVFFRNAGSTVKCDVVIDSDTSATDYETGALTVVGGISTQENIYAKYNISAGDGTVSLPSLSFHADTNTGFYRIGADNIGMALGGVLRINYKDSIISISDHESSAPSANTGLMKVGMGGLVSDVNYAGNYGYYLKNHNSAGYTEYNVTNDSPVNARFGIGGSTAAAGYAGNAYIYSASNIKLQFAMNGNINAYTDTNGIGAATGKALYIGDESTDGSWKFVDSGGTLKIQKRVSGSWVDKGAFV